MLSWLDYLNIIYNNNLKKQKTVDVAKPSQIVNPLLKP